ncbi:iron chaperone [Leptospira idonii]|uniref:DUF1801 domain-containing protein n=1 Tax=Leptospira idonii TaxID=1193500 RepID=A0A4R9M198_9LEPT|nr:DUF1801 domain-containing protein [Leptospira idonii]TGN20524.1 DUF1801 domain-containing protein [Leptospira idonii]
MDSKKAKVQTIDEYISGFPKDVQKMLQQLRETIRKAAPKAEEKISYGMPAFALKRNLVYFAANKKHIGFYPTSGPITQFESSLTRYKYSKGTIQFPFGEPLPLALITKMVKFRVKEDAL